MSYCWFNKQELLENVKEKYENGGKEKAAKYYQVNKDFIKQKTKTSIKIFKKKKKKEESAKKKSNLFLQYKDQ